MSRSAIFACTVVLAVVIVTAQITGLLLHAGVYFGWWQ